MDEANEADVADKPTNAVEDPTIHQANDSDEDKVNETDIRLMKPLMKPKIILWPKAKLRPEAKLWLKAKIRLVFSLTKYSVIFTEVEGDFETNNNQLRTVNVTGSVKIWSK